jgi:hypothetical protein
MNMNNYKMYCKTYYKNREYLEYDCWTVLALLLRFAPSSLSPSPSPPPRRLARRRRNGDCVGGGRRLGALLRQLQTQRRRQRVRDLQRRLRAHRLHPALRLLLVRHRLPPSVLVLVSPHTGLHRRLLPLRRQARQRPLRCAPLSSLCLDLAPVLASNSFLFSWFFLLTGSSLPFLSVSACDRDRHDEGAIRQAPARGGHVRQRQGRLHRARHLQRHHQPLRYDRARRRTCG